MIIKKSYISLTKYITNYKKDQIKNGIYLIINYFIYV